MTDRPDPAREYQEFLEAAAAAPPLPATQHILSTVRQDLTPAPLRVFLKVSAAVAVSGSASLLLCPQFGMGGGHHSEVHHLFMSLGPLGCSLACGTFFSVLGFVVALALLRPEELRLVRRNRFLLAAALSALSLSAFVCLGASMLLESGLLWFFGSWLGGLVSIEAAATAVFRKRAAARSGE